MKVHQIFTDSPLRNFTYLIESNDNDWYCIDPWSADDVIARLGESKGSLRAIINTHEHWDHTKGNAELKDLTGCEVLAHPSCLKLIDTMTRSVDHQDEIDLGGGDMMVMLETPGHTMGHLCILLVENQRPKAVLTGDTLFNAGVGHCRSGGAPETLYKTIKDIFGNLDNDVLVYPGHEYLGNNLRFALSVGPDNKEVQKLLSAWEKINWSHESIVTSMGIEREVNPFLRLDAPEIISNLKGDTKNNEQVFLRLRELRDNW